MTTTPRLDMNAKLKQRTDLTVQSFSYVAGKLAQSSHLQMSTPLYEQILGEAEKHRSALRLMQRDISDLANEGLRTKALSDVRAQRIRDTAAKTIELAYAAITRITSQYAPQRMAA
jgi:hypothetical protein